MSLHDLRRTSGLSPSWKFLDTPSAHDHQPSESQSIAQVLSDAVHDTVPLSPSSTRSTLKHLGLVNGISSRVFKAESEISGVEDEVDHNDTSQHTRYDSSASAALPDINPVSLALRRIASESQLQKYQQDTTADGQALYRMLQRATQGTHNLQGVLDKVKADLERKTKKKHALKHKQDEENETLKIQLRKAESKHRALQAEVEGQAAQITELKKTNAKITEDLQVALFERDELKKGHRAAKVSLEQMAAELVEKTTKLDTVTENRDKREKLLRKCGLDNASLNSHVKDLDSRIVVLTKEKEDAEKQMEKYRSFSKALYQERKSEGDKVAVSEVEITELKSLLASKTSALADTKAHLDLLRKEQETWRERMDAMVHKVFASERRVRMLNHAALTLKPQYSGNEAGAHVIKRGSNGKPNTPSTEIVNAVEVLNTNILNTATVFAPLFHPSTSPTWPKSSERSKVVLGEWVTSLFRKDGWHSAWFLQSVIQMFLVDWCRAIIEAWYPQQQSFAELFLMGLSANKQLSRKDFTGEVKFQAIQTSTSDITPDFGSWAKEILDDLLQIVPLNTDVTAQYRDRIYLPQMVSLVQYAYHIRQALAEEDICGNIHLLIPPSDIQFEPDSMNARSNSIGFEIQKKPPADLGDIAGCASLGLQSITVQKSQSGSSFIDHNILLPPDVILARDLTSKPVSPKPSYFPIHR